MVVVTCGILSIVKNLSFALVQVIESEDSQACETSMAVQNRLWALSSTVRKHLIWVPSHRDTLYIYRIDICESNAIFSSRRWCKLYYYSSRHISYLSSSVTRDVIHSTRDWSWYVIIVEMTCWMHCSSAVLYCVCQTKLLFPAFSRHSCHQRHGSPCIVIMRMENNWYQNTVIDKHQLFGIQTKHFHWALV